MLVVSFLDHIYIYKTLCVSATATRFSAVQILHKFIKIHVQ